MLGKLIRAKEILINEGMSSFFKKLGSKIYYFVNQIKPLVTIRKKIFRPSPNKKYLNIGGGNWYYPRWENIDFYADRVYVDYNLDLRTKTKIPIKDETVKIIFSSHFFEHISDEDCLFVLRESYRLLMPNGVIRISVPDMEKAFLAYRNNDHDFFDKGGVDCIGDSIERKLVNFFASYAKDNYSGGPIVSAPEVKEKANSLERYEFCNWCVKQIPDDAPYKAHVNAYDFEKLKAFLDSIGFREIRKSGYRQSSVKVLRSSVFDNRPVVSLNVEAKK